MSAALAPSAPALPPLPTGIPTSRIVDVATFREHRPEFADVLTYPDAMVQMFIDVGSIALNPGRWLSMMQFGVELFVCHMLALGQYSMRAAPGIPGAGIGVVNNKSVSKVSVGYDTQLAAIEGAGPWNLTLYGTQLIWWSNILGAGGYEALSAGYQESLSGIVNTWARGVMIGWYNGGAGR